METKKNRRARELFDGIAEGYDRVGEALSLWQNRRWRRFLVSRLDVRPGERVLDLATGTGGVALQVARRYSCPVIGLDLSEQMLSRGRRNVRRAGLEHLVALAPGRAEQVEYPDGWFDAVAFTYLLRYVEDVEATLEEMIRVLKPGGRLASLEFAVPQSAVVRGLWLLYTRGVLPVIASAISRGWRDVGWFLGPSISRFYRRHSVEQIRQTWVSLGVPDAAVRRMSWGGAVIMWGTKSPS